MASRLLVVVNNSPDQVELIYLSSATPTATAASAAARRRKQNMIALMSSSLSSGAHVDAAASCVMCAHSFQSSQAQLACKTIVEVRNILRPELRKNFAKT